MASPNENSGDSSNAGGDQSTLPPASGATASTTTPERTPSRIIPSGSPMRTVGRGGCGPPTTPNRSPGTPSWRPSQVRPWPTSASHVGGAAGGSSSSPSAAGGSGGGRDAVAPVVAVGGSSGGGGGIVISGGSSSQSRKRGRDGVIFGGGRGGGGAGGASSLSNVPRPEPRHHCHMCDRSFFTEKGLFGHMRSHPERQYRGMNPPPAFDAQREMAELISGLANNANNNNNNQEAVEEEKNDETAAMEEDEKQEEEEEEEEEREEGESSAAASARRNIPDLNQPPPTEWDE